MDSPRALRNEGTKVCKGTPDQNMWIQIEKGRLLIPATAPSAKGALYTSLGRTGVPGERFCSLGWKSPRLGALRGLRAESPTYRGTTIGRAFSPRIFDG